MRSRRSLFVAIAIGLSIITIAALIAIKVPAPGRAHEITLLYVGADDCAPCRKWQREDGALFQTTAEFRNVTYREVKSPTLFDLLKDENWPEDLRSFRDRLGPGAGVPLWLVLADGRIVEQQSGASRWQAAILPKIKSMIY